MGNLHARENRCIRPQTGPDVKGDSFALQQSHRNEEAKNGVKSDTDVQPDGGEEPRARREVTVQNEPFVLLRSLICDASELVLNTAKHVIFYRL